MIPPKRPEKKFFRPLATLWQVLLRVGEGGKLFFRNSKKRIACFKNPFVRYSLPVLFLQKARFKLLGAYGPLI